MQLLLAAGALILGAIVGSFLNALSFRWGTGVSIVWGPSTSLDSARDKSLRASRSRCMHCGTTLAAADLVPILSYLFLRGHCRHCGTHIPSQYPLVEVTAALLSFGVYLIHPEALGYAYWLLVWMVLLFVVVYDARHKVIPWSCSALLAALAAAGLWAGLVPVGWLSWWAGPLLAAPLVLLWLVSRGRWMGLGDGALELGLGWLLGMSAGLTALLLAFWVGAFVGIMLLLGRRGVTMRSEVPFAPFLILGAAAAYFLHVDFFATLPLLFS